MHGEPDPPRPCWRCSDRGVVFVDRTAGPPFRDYCGCTAGVRAKAAEWTNGEHWLRDAARDNPYRVSTSADPDLVTTLGDLRRELDEFTAMVVDGSVTAAERDRMVQLLEDFAGVIRVTVGTQVIGDALGEP